MINIDSDTIEAKLTSTQGRQRHHGNATGAATRPALRNSVAALKLLTRNRGASIAELATLTGWQPHSVRAHLSGLRKKGIVLLRETRKTGEGAYRVANAGGGDSAPTVREDGPAVDTAGVAHAADAGIATVTAA